MVDTQHSNNPATPYTSSLPNSITHSGWRVNFQVTEAVVGSVPFSAEQLGALTDLGLNFSFRLVLLFLDVIYEGSMNTILGKSLWILSQHFFYLLSQELFISLGSYYHHFLVRNWFILVPLNIQAKLYQTLILGNMNRAPTWHLWLEWQQEYAACFLRPEMTAERWSKKESSPNSGSFILLRTPHLSLASPLFPL